MNLAEALQGINSMAEDKFIHAVAPFSPTSEAYLEDWKSPRESLYGPNDDRTNVCVVGSLKDIWSMHVFLHRKHDDSEASVKSTIDHFEKLRKEREWFSAMTRTTDYYEVEYGFTSEPATIDRLRLVGCNAPMLHTELVNTFDDCDGDYGPAEVSVSVEDIAAFIVGCKTDGPTTLNCSSNPNIVWTLCYVYEP